MRKTDNDHLGGQGTPTRYRVSRAGTSVSDGLPQSGHATCLTQTFLHTPTDGNFSAAP